MLLFGFIYYYQSLDCLKGRLQKPLNSTEFNEDVVENKIITKTESTLMVIVEINETQQIPINEIQQFPINIIDSQDDLKIHEKSLESMERLNIIEQLPITKDSVIHNRPIKSKSESSLSL